MHKKPGALRARTVRRQRLLSCGRVATSDVVVPKPGALRSRPLRSHSARPCADQRRGRCRDGFALIEPEVVAEQVEIDADELNVVIAWLEKCGTLERLTDATTRGVITLGRTEPDDQDERRRFRTC